MSRFRFRLQKVLELRESRERKAGIELARAQQLADHARSLQEAIEARHDAGRAIAKTTNSECVTAGALQGLHALIAQLAEHVEHARAASVEAEQKVAEVRADLTEAARARQVLESLRERKHMLWRVAQLGMEQKQMDEVALTRHTNGGKAAS